MNKICKTCYWWENKKGVYGDCEFFEILDLHEETPNPKKEPAFVNISICDDTGLTCGFYTIESFSCSGWKEKDKKI